MRIGISVFTHTGQDIWESGKAQGALFLAALLQRIGFVERVVLLDTGDQHAMPPQVDMAALGLDLLTPQAATDAVDVVIEMTGAWLPGDWLAYFRACGGKACHFNLGHPHARLGEPVLFTDNAAWVPYGRCDGVWVRPSGKDFAPMLRTLHRCPVQVAPFLWSPYFIARRADEIERAGFHFGYRPGASRPSDGWRLALFEPNISVVQTCMVPMLICDAAYRQQPARIASMQVLNTLHMKDHLTMLFMANSLDLVRQHRAVFHGRHDIAGFMAQHADAVVAHQWQDEQAHSPLEALYGGYPLVHNAPWLRDAGYYYPDFDIAAGAAQLLRAAQEHDAHVDGYRARAQRVIDAVDPQAQANVDAYARLLRDLVEKAPAA